MPPVIPFIPAIITTTAGFIGARKGAKAQESAERTAREFAQGQSEEARAEQARLEEKFGLTEGELEREERTFA